MIQHDIMANVSFHNKNYVIIKTCQIFLNKADTPFGQVKLSELGAWFSRRNKSPNALAGAMSRAWWRWQHKYVQPKRAGIAPFFQITVAAMTFFYVINYGKMRHHRNYKYH